MNARRLTPRSYNSSGNDRFRNTLPPPPGGGLHGRAYSTRHGTASAAVINARGPTQLHGRPLTPSDLAGCTAVALPPGKSTVKAHDSDASIQPQRTPLARVAPAPLEGAMGGE